MRATHLACDTDFYGYTHSLPVGRCRRMALRVYAAPCAQVHLSLRDPRGVIRAQLMCYKPGFSDYALLGPTQDESSVNALAGPISPGNWRLEFSVRAVPAAGGGLGAREYGADVLYGPDAARPDGPVTPAGGLAAAPPEAGGSMPGKKVICGDFHNHTTVSDGQMTPAQAMSAAEHKGMGFYAVTEHNVFPFGWPATGCVALRGTELTTPNGHFNLLGMGGPVPLFSTGGRLDINTCDGLAALLGAVRNGGGTVLLNHPCFTPWHLRFRDLTVGLVHSMEVICDPTHPRSAKAAALALAVWNRLLNDGWRIWGHGGSDCHLAQGARYDGATLPANTGDPLNYLDAVPDEKHILAALKNGALSVSRHGMLTAAHGSAGGDITCALRGGGPVAGVQGLCCRLVVDGQAVDERPIAPQQPCRFGAPALPGALWWRLDLRDAAGDLAGFTNPVFLKHKRPRYRRWGDYL